MRAVQFGPSLPRVLFEGLNLILRSRLEFSLGLDGGWGCNVRIKIRGLGMHHVNKVQVQTCVSFYDKLMLLERKKWGQKCVTKKPRSTTHFVRTFTKIMHSSALYPNPSHPN